MKGNIMSDPANSPAGDPANSGDAVSVVDVDGNFTENWLEQFDEADRPTLGRFTETGFRSLGKSYVDLQRQFRNPDDYVKMPKDDSPDEERAEFHRRRGVPDTADYKYEQPETLPENLRSNEDEMKYYYELAKSANLTPAQFKKMADGHFANLEKVFATQDLIAQEANHKANAEADAALTKKFGKAKDERIARANAVMRHYGGVEAVAALKLENNPLMVEFIDRIAEDMSEDRIKGITTTTIPTAAALDNRIDELRKNPAFANSSHPDHRKVNAELQELYKQKYPD